MTIHKQGRLRAEKVEYPDGIGCCIWYPFPGDDSEDTGLAWDFAYDDIDDLIVLLKKMKIAEPDIFEEDEP